MQAAAAVVRDSRVSLKGRACAAGCLKLYMARTPQELIAAGVTTNSPAAGEASVSTTGAGPLGTAQGSAVPGPSPRAIEEASAPASLPQASLQPALASAASPGASLALGASSAGLSMSSPGPAPQKKAKLPVGRAKKSLPAEPVSFALGWFADSGENDGEERLWLEEQMLVADGVKEKVGTSTETIAWIAPQIVCASVTLPSCPRSQDSLLGQVSEFPLLHLIPGTTMWRKLNMGSHHKSLYPFELRNKTQCLVRYISIQMVEIGQMPS